MISLIRSPRTAQWGSAAFVAGVACTVGHYASQGFDAHQWLASGFAVAGSVAVAAMVWAPQTATQGSRRRG